MVNISGHSDTAYFKAMPMSNIKVQMKGDFHYARAVMSGNDLAVSHSGRYSAFTVPALEDYELIDLP